MLGKLKKTAKQKHIKQLKIKTLNQNQRFLIYYYIWVLRN